MNILQVIVLGIVQGATEFLPVSSSGHLVVARIFFHIDDLEGQIVDGFLHLGTLLAVLIYYRSVWLGILRGLFVRDEEGQDKRQLLLKLIVATIPGALIGYFFEDIINSAFRGSTSLAIGFLITAALLLIGDWFGKQIKTPDRATYKDALLIGLAQIISLLPSVSRSGSTIAAGRMLGLSRRQATSFSFLMSAPIIAGAGLFSLDTLLVSDSLPVSLMIAGFLASFISGLVAIYLLLKVIDKISFAPFVVYLVLLSLTLFMFA